MQEIMEIVRRAERMEGLTMWKSARRLWERAADACARAGYYKCQDECRARWWQAQRHVAQTSEWLACDRVR